jgi:hypothetical protein
LYRDEAKKRLVVAFRGTSDPGDLATDAKILQSPWVKKLNENEPTKQGEVVHSMLLLLSLLLFLFYLFLLTLFKILDDTTYFSTTPGALFGLSPSIPRHNGHIKSPLN